MERLDAQKAGVEFDNFPGHGPVGGEPEMLVRHGEQEGVGARFNASSVIIVAAWRLNSGVYWHALWSSVGFLVREDDIVLPPSTFRGEDHRMGAADNDDERGPSARAEHPLHGHTIPVGSSNPLL